MTSPSWEDIALNCEDAAELACEAEPPIDEPPTDEPEAPLIAPEGEVPVKLPRV